MGKKEIVRRYMVFLLGLACVCLGATLAIKTNLGTSPIISLPYTFSLVLPQLTVGNWTIIYSIIMLSGHVILMHKDYRKITSILHLIIIQAVVSIVMGYMIDLFMFCMGWLNVEIYVLQVVILLIACVITALGVFFQLNAKVTMLPPDMFIISLVKFTKKEYGRVRVTFDVTNVLLAAAIGLIFIGELAGVREGTLLCALLVGNIVRYFNKNLQPLIYFLLPYNRPDVGKEKIQNE